MSMLFLEKQDLTMLPNPSIELTSNGLRPSGRSSCQTLGIAMKLVSHGTFDRLQQSLAEELIRIVKRELESVDAPSEMIEQLSGSIAFSVASLLDDVAGFERNGEAVSPILTFLVGEGELEFAGGNSWMHEYIYRLLPAVLAEGSKQIKQAVEA
jgi:hypothetical protein